jgi:hypothetical protein
MARAPRAARRVPHVAVVQAGWMVAGALRSHCGPLEDLQEWMDMYRSMLEERLDRFWELLDHTKGAVIRVLEHRGSATVVPLEMFKAPMSHIGQQGPSTSVRLVSADFNTLSGVWRATAGNKASSGNSCDATMTRV